MFIYRHWISLLNRSKNLRFPHPNVAKMNSLEKTCKNRLKSLNRNCLIFSERDGTYAGPPLGLTGRWALQSPWSPGGHCCYPLLWVFGETGVVGAGMQPQQSIHLRVKQGESPCSLQPPWLLASMSFYGNQILWEICGLHLQYINWLSKEQTFLKRTCRAIFFFSFGQWTIETGLRSRCSNIH